MNQPPQSFHYPFEALRGDYIRAGIGFVLTLVPLLHALESVIASLILGPLVAVFATFGIATWFRQKTTLTISDEGVTADGPRSVAISWDELERIDLRYFSTRRDKTGGWLQLRLDAPGKKLRVDSNLNDFERFTRHVASAVPRCETLLTDVAKENLAAMGSIHRPQRSVT